MKIDIFNTNKKYNIIYADPPWEYKESGSGSRVVKSHYPTMEIEQIKKLPIPKIAEETSILFIWVTFPRLEQGLEVIKGNKSMGIPILWTCVRLGKNIEKRTAKLGDGILYAPKYRNMFDRRKRQKTQNKTAMP